MLIILISGKKNWRKQNNVKQENVQLLAYQSYFTNQILSDPDEVWKLENVLKEKIYSFIKYFDKGGSDKFGACLLCFIFNEQPSFILFSTASNQNALIDEFKIGRKTKEF